MTQPSAPRPGALQSGRIPELDGVRGVAILLVLVHHFAGLPFQAAPGLAAACAGRALGMTWSGVDLFFVLSGFLIGGILIDQKGARGFFKAFYLRRACRIFPLYTLWLLFFAALLALQARHPGSDLIGRLAGGDLPFWSYALYIQNILMAGAGSFGSRFMSHTWSLAVEEQFYLVLPFVVWLLPSRRLAGALVCGVVAAPVLRTVCLVLYPEGGLHGYVLMPCRADSLLLGVLGAWAVRDSGARAWLAREHQRLQRAFWVLLAGAAGLAAFSPSYKTPLMMSWGYSWLAVTYLLFILLAVAPPRGLAKGVAGLACMQWLGTVAYGVYIYHQAVNYAVHGLLFGQKPRLMTWEQALATLASLGLTLAIAAASWRWFEKRFVTLGHSVAYRA